MQALKSQLGQVLYFKPTQPLASHSARSSAVHLPLFPSLLPFRALQKLHPLQYRLQPLVSPILTHQRLHTIHFRVFLRGLILVLEVRHFQPPTTHIIRVRIRKVQRPSLLFLTQALFRPLARALRLQVPFSHTPVQRQSLIPVFCPRRHGLLQSRFLVVLLSGGQA